MKWETDVEFCPDMGELTTDKMAGMIANEVFSADSFASVLKVRYEQMKEKFATTHCADYGIPTCGEGVASHLVNIHQRTKPDARLRVDNDLIHPTNGSILAELFTQSCFGHDMPVWFRNKNAACSAKKKIMLISQDPKRTPYLDKIGAITISTPFGVHSADYRRYTQNDVVSRFIDYLGNSYGIVYLTDARKLYVETGEVSRLVQKKDNALRAKFDNSIREEVESFDPDLIVTFGNEVVDGRFTDTFLNHVRPSRLCAEVQKVHDGNCFRNVVASCHPRPRFMSAQEVNERFRGLANKIDSHFGREIET
ncbi:MAG: hypothetical protein K6G91_11445 [Kiritimatiellae bacterium]|nr:hypothetical protein [Kiritimatiellia bacterium]